jgi:hypothetical protein
LWKTALETDFQGIAVVHQRLRFGAVSFTHHTDWVSRDDGVCWVAVFVALAFSDSRFVWQHGASSLHRAVPFLWVSMYYHLLWDHDFRGRCACTTFRHSITWRLARIWSIVRLDCEATVFLMVILSGLVAICTHDELVLVGSGYYIDRFSVILHRHDSHLIEIWKNDPSYLEMLCLLWGPKVPLGL